MAPPPTNDTRERPPCPAGHGFSAGRDPYLDILRVASIGLVVLGHWLQLVAGRLHPVVAWAPWATWLFQVIPVFCMVGGYANAGSWQRAQARGETWSAWVRRRAHRLLAPLAPLVLFWAIVSPVVIALGMPRALAAIASQAALVPIWFLGVYLAVIAIVPLTWRWHRRSGILCIVVLVAIAVIVDVLARVGIPLIGEANVIFVWAAIHQIGYFLRDPPRQLQRAWGPFWALAGLCALFGLVFLADYPVSMVAVGQDGANNARPPTVALVALAIVQLGAVLTARPAAERWLERARVRSAIAALGGITLAVYLWHMTAIVLTGAIVYGLGLWPEAPLIEASRWPSSPLWILTGALILVALVSAFRPFEGGEPRFATRKPWSIVLGLTATLAAIAWIVRRGLFAPETAWWVSALVVVLLLGGLAALGALVSGRRRSQPES